MIKFPSIEQYRNAIKNVKIALQEQFDQTGSYPTLPFKGTVKLHGTNAGITLDRSTGKMQYQSRERVLSLTSDNAMFFQSMASRPAAVNQLFEQLIAANPSVAADSTLAIFGEWCGANIQSGVAITGLPRMFVVFKAREVRSDASTQWLSIDGVGIKDENIYNADWFPTYTVDIDFNRPELAQDQLQKLTEQVENECPAGKYFGVSGVGEGLVWSCAAPGMHSSKFWFKTKGQKHSVSKVRKIASVDVEAINNVNEFADTVATEQRFQQGLDNVLREQQLPFEMSSIGAFIKWVNTDVFKEEQDTILANGLNPKMIGSELSRRSRTWFIQQYNKSA